LDWYESRRSELYRQVLRLLQENPEFNFTFCQVWPLRQFLTKSPETRDEFSKLLRQGRIEIVGGTETISDLNMASPLALERNIVSGLEWLDKEFDYHVRAAAFEDAFGVPSQLPQLIKHWGYEFFKAGRMPRPGLNDVCGDFLWRGYDGTIVRCVSPGADGCSWGWGYPDNPDEPGVPEDVVRYERIKKQLQLAASSEADNILFVAMGEEHDIYNGICRLVGDLNGENAGVEFRFSSYQAYYDSLDDHYWRNVPVIENTDLSRIFTGCYTSRRTSKLNPRRLESRLMAAGVNAELDRAWDALYLMQFHDAICGCHIDENAARLDNLYDEMMAGIHEQPAVIPWARRLPEFHVRPASAIAPCNSVLAFGKWQIAFRNGFPEDLLFAGKSVGRVGDLHLREENGTLWTEEYSGKIRAFPTSSEKLLYWGLDEACCEIVTEDFCSDFRSMWPGFSRLKIQKTLRIFRDSPLVMASWKLDWLGNSTEIAVRWHSGDSPLAVCRAEVPFGSVERLSYIPCMLQGDAFPALNWVRGRDFAVINTGTPAHALRGGALETILLRSPVKRWAPWFPVTPPESSWDNGVNRFDFIYHADAVNVSNAELHRLGMEYNIAMVAEPEYHPIENVPENLVVAGAVTGKDGRPEWLMFEANGQKSCFGSEFQPWQIGRAARNE